MAKQRSNLVCGLVYFADLVEIVVSHWLFSVHAFVKRSTFVHNICVLVQGQE